MLIKIVFLSFMCDITIAAGDLHKDGFLDRVKIF